VFELCKINIGFAMVKHECGVFDSLPPTANINSNNNENYISQTEYFKSALLILRKYSLDDNL
jgi:hypothetical protein